VRIWGIVVSKLIESIDYERWAYGEAGFAFAFPIFTFLTTLRERKQILAQKESQKYQWFMSEFEYRNTRVQIFFFYIVAIS
jgi:hypothetical protein